MEKLTPPDKSAKIAELKRELKQRNAVYPKLIQSKRLPRDRANRQVFVLKCILDDYIGNQGNHGIFIRWKCPVCGCENSSHPGEEIVRCEVGHGCKQGPFYLRQVPARRAMNTEVIHEALKIEGIVYDYQAQQSMFQ